MPRRPCWVRRRKPKRLLYTLGRPQCRVPVLRSFADGPLHPPFMSESRMASNGVHRKNTTRTQDAQAQTVEKGETATTVRQKSALGPRKANAMTASSVSSSYSELASLLRTSVNSSTNTL